MIASKSSKAIEIDAKVTAKHSIIWLHGLGADGSDFVPIVPELKLPPELGIRFIFPHAPIMPVTINNGDEMRAWYDIYSLNSQTKIDEAGILASVELINQYIDQEVARGIATENIILAGFSQGAVIALSTGLRYQKPLAGILALSGYLPLAEKVLASTSATNTRTPIFIAHGTEDPIVPYALGKAAYVALEQSAHAVTWRSYPIQHTVSLAEIKDISAWIQSIWH